MKLLIVFWTLLGTLWSATYDPFLLETQLSLLPKIVLLEKNVIASPKKTSVRILIAYDYGDEEAAGQCVRILSRKFNGVLNGKPFQIAVSPIDKISPSSQYQLVYALKMSTSQLEKLRSLVETDGTVTSLYDSPKLQESGYLLSIRLERSPVILVNANALKKNNVSFPDHLLEMARIVE
ncbi:MAG: hypothetical protein AB7U26_10310 [Sulfuricurvum sp.]